MIHTYNNQIGEYPTPLELLNLYYSDGQTTGNKTKKLWVKINSLLSWDNLLNRGYHSDLCPLLFFIITKFLPDIDSRDLLEDKPYKETFPDSIILQLKKYYIANLAKNMSAFDDFAKVLRAFTENKIDVIILKGAALAESVYPDIGLRPMSDVDLLVKEKDLLKVKKLLCNINYHEARFQHHSIEESDSTKFVYFKSEQDRGFSLDLHLNVVRKSCFATIDTDEIWTDAHHISIAGIDTFMPSYEHLLLHTCWHSLNHLFPKLIWISDIAQLTMAFEDSIAWEVIERTAKRWKISRCVYHSLYLNSMLMTNRIPKNALSCLNPGIIQERLFSFIIVTNMNNKSIERPNHIFLFLLQVLLIDKIKDRTRFFCKYFGQHVFPATRYIMERFSLSSSRKMPLYWPIHLIILLCGISRWLWEIIDHRATNGSKGAPKISIKAARHL